MEESCGGIIVNNGNVVVVKQTKTNTWSLPKGHVDVGETCLQTAIREIHEETGLQKLELIKELGSYVRPVKSLPGVMKKITFYLFTTEETVLEPCDVHNPIARWVSIDEVPSYLSYDEDKKFYKSILHELEKV
jgi:bis(5'-nucleosidyl)-tetraphosphatase